MRKSSNPQNVAYLAAPREPNTPLSSPSDPQGSHRRPTRLLPGQDYRGPAPQQERLTHLGFPQDRGGGTQPFH